jgi:hypothetical protein
VPHISPGFGQMWDLTDAGAKVPVASEISGSRAVNSHISPKEGEIWGTLGSWYGNIPGVVSSWEQNKLLQPSRMLSSSNEGIWVPQCSRGVRARTWV